MNDAVPTVALIGPPSTGKSTLAPLVAERLNMASVSLDDLRWAYYDEMGYDRTRADEIMSPRSLEGLYAYWKPFEVAALEAVLKDHSGKVIELGGGHSVYEDAQLFKRARQALLPVPFVVLVMPSSDLDQSCEILRVRTLEKAPLEGWEPSEAVLGLFEHLARHPSNRLLAKQVVYTLGRTPAETAEEIARLVDSQVNP